MAEQDDESSVRAQGDPATVPSETGSADANPRLAARLFVLPAIVGGIIILVLAVYFLFSALTRSW